MSEKVTLGELVRQHADGKKLGKLNLRQFKDRKNAHVGVCKELVALSDKYGKFPMTTLVYFAVNKEAHRKNVLANGYRSIDTKKANTIIKWMKLVAKQSGQKNYARDANVAHALCKYYDKVSKKTKDFVAALDSLDAPIAKAEKAELFKVVSTALGM